MSDEKEPFPYNDQDTAISLSVDGVANGFVADQIMPYVPVDRRKFGWMEHDFGEEIQQTDDVISEKGQANEVEFSGTKHTGNVVDRGLKHTYTNEQVAEMSGRNPLGTRIRKLTNVMLRNREVRTCNVIKDPANAAQIETLSAGNRIGDSGVKTIDIFEDLRLGMLFPANSVAASETVFSKIRRASDVIKAFNGTLGDDGMVPLEWLRQYLGFDRLIIGKAKANKAEKGLPAQISNVWDSDFLSLFYQNPDLSLNLEEDITFGLTARWKSPGVGRGGRIAGRKKVDVGLYGGWQIRTGESVKEVVLSKDCLSIIQNPVNL